MKFEDIGAIAGAALHKEPDELTEDERVAIAVMAGCAYDFDWIEMRLSIKNPIGFVKINGKLEVRESIARRGDTVRRGAEP